MIILTTDENGKVIGVEQIPDLPSNYECPEWKAYDLACDEAQAAGIDWTDKQAETFAAYHEAQKRNFQ